MCVCVRVSVCPFSQRAGREAGRLASQLTDWLADRPTGRLANETTGTEAGANTLDFFIVYHVNLTAAANCHQKRAKPPLKIQLIVED